MNIKQSSKRLHQRFGKKSIEKDLASYRLILEEINRAGESLIVETDNRLQEIAVSLKERAQKDIDLDDLLIGVFALVREVASRVLGMRPFNVQVIAGIALHQKKLVEMKTGEGKTLVAVLPACLNALKGHGVHILTFNDYLARRDAAWMGPIYRFLGLSVGTIQQGMKIDARQTAYKADVTYATVKEAGFDFLRGNLCRDPDQLVHRSLNYAIVDEADSILVDEARVPLVIAGDQLTSGTNLYRIAGVVNELEEGEDWAKDENGRNTFITERGFNQVEEALKCTDLHNEENYLLLTEINQALHARTLLKRDVDYIVRDERIELVDEFTGRVVADRRWPDGLQEALEAKEKLPIQPGGRILGSITIQHFLNHYQNLAGMTATALPSASELESLYGLELVSIPSNKPCIREDLPDIIFTHKEAKYKALVREIITEHETGRPVLVGTSSVEESELLAVKLKEAGIECQVLNAKNDEAEAEIIAEAGTLGALTISTNMAGRGTDIRLGGISEAGQEEVVRLGGLYVIGTNRHESRRIDDQLRGRAGRQGDPGASRFLVSLEDDLMLRFGIHKLIPARLHLPLQEEPTHHPAIRREVDRIQRIAEGQNSEIRKTLWRYSSLVEKQREIIQKWRIQVLMGEEKQTLCAIKAPERYNLLRVSFGEKEVQRAECVITLHYIDKFWADYLAYVTHVREGIHMAGFGNRDPLQEFHKQITDVFLELRQSIEDKIVETFIAAEINEDGINLDKNELRGPSSTWTYLINDRALSDLQQMLIGLGNSAFAPGAVLTAWPMLVLHDTWWWLTKRKKGNNLLQKRDAK